MLKEYFDSLKSEAGTLGYRVELDSTRNKACHHPNNIIFIRKPETIVIIYSFAHEVGHCIDFKKGNLDFQKYRVDRIYRFRKEIMAWYYGLLVCRRLSIPINQIYFRHAKQCLSTYMKF